jgi:hypothetical protein
LLAHISPLDIGTVDGKAPGSSRHRPSPCAPTFGAHVVGVEVARAGFTRRRA